ncbi:DNA mismatch repair endonuclease MutL [Agrilactobacillus yilanensis]|uniref:DNA mismatch repair protein MutL n=1 Tax=Agrilactobacillus yilanensis TaxID=2485997 RepID=A0ABW4J686_9LACO|nr:DNA mismatch repair endonuclease MutL [Agrilactobacillus yilanensis]
MAEIHELSEQLSNQIAAGEVIERPASVVKELAENALDAQATQIDINVVDAGLSKITISDNGQGIPKTQVALAFLPHTTSKITSRDDLFRVHSLGFRGEALASIAAVAKVTMLTATESGLGTQIDLAGGQVLAQKSQTSRQGTFISVNDLFYNTPARLKYVKSVSTELAHIADIVNRLALAHPQTAWTFANNGNILLKTSGSGDLLRTITEIYSISIGRQMLPLKGHDLDFQINGFVSLPKLTRASRNYVSLFINGRYVKNAALTKALIAGYGSKLMVGRYPLAIINLQMDPFLVDVNVHPTKQEVRLSKEDALGQLLTTSVLNTLQPQNLIPDAVANLSGTTAPKIKKEQLAMMLDATSKDFLSQSSPDAQTVQEPVAQNYQAVNSPAPITKPAEPTVEPELPTTSIFDEPKRLAAWDSRYQTEKNVWPFGQAATEEVAAKAPPVSALADQTATRFPKLRYIGQIHGTYLIAESTDGFYLIDQHAAQERVNYEKYRQAIGEVSQDQQNLLVPIVLNYSSAEQLAIQDRLPLLQQVGVQLENFGQNSFIVHTHPTWFKAGQEEATIREMIDGILADKQMTVAKFREKTAIMMSCKRAIKANHHLDDQQAKALLVKLSTAENPFNCPHGRPVLVQFTEKDLGHMFKRIQDAHESYGL